MTNQEIDIALALAIGYAPDRVRKRWPTGFERFVQVLNDYDRGDGPMQYGGWQRFDHTDPAVIWPIAEMFDAFPSRWRKDECVASIGTSLLGSKVHRVAATATALAVIEHCDQRPTPATYSTGGEK